VDIDRSVIVTGIPGPAKTTIARAPISRSAYEADRLAVGLGHEVLRKEFVAEPFRGAAHRNN